MVALQLAPAVAHGAHPGRMTERTALLAIALVFMSLAAAFGLFAAYVAMAAVMAPALAAAVTAVIAAACGGIMLMIRHWL